MTTIIRVSAIQTNGGTFALLDLFHDTGNTTLVTTVADAIRSSLNARDAEATMSTKIYSVTDEWTFARGQITIRSSHPWQRFLQQVAAFFSHRRDFRNLTVEEGAVLDENYVAFSVLYPMNERTLKELLDGLHNFLADIPVFATT